ncbi:hypothetical protein OS493_016633 [Desmophyllum pertusum]|uniref:Uncharacterized protein n=1 Tax=Desmophyllum pertusum TaxID=174260 RepID=A0A9W9ZCV6_9CNID|nr:hypothetical protein OS493_016633 [Desmophyllum pertusum]
MKISSIPVIKVSGLPVIYVSGNPVIKASGIPVIEASSFHGDQVFFSSKALLYFHDYDEPPNDEELLSIRRLSHASTEF